MKNILLIFNPVSGKKKARLILHRIVEFLSKNGCRTVVFATSRQGEAIEIVINHSEEANQIICCGGDGTLNEVFSGLALLGKNTPVGYIPTGTSNDFSRSLGLSQPTKRLIEIALNGVEQNIDIGTFNEEQYFMYVASFGAFTKVSYETPQWLKNRMGKASYFFYGLSEIADIRPRQVKIQADDKVIEGEFVFGSVSNSTFFGGMPIFQEGSITVDDGKFEVLLIKPLKSPKNLQDILQGMLLHEYNKDSVLFFTASELAFTFTEDVPWTVDGEYAGESDNVIIRNLHRLGRVLVER